jgi:hypothetical protein
VAKELRAIPDGAKSGVSNAAKKQYINDTIRSCQITTAATFGFAEADSYAGFSHGTFMSDTERQRYADHKLQQQILNKAKRGDAALSNNLGDAAVATSSFYSVVLTDEDPKKRGPIKNAFAQGSKIVYLREFEAQRLSLREYILSKIYGKGNEL